MQSVSGGQEDITDVVARDGGGHHRKRLSCDGREVPDLVRRYGAVVEVEMELSYG